MESVCTWLPRVQAMQNEGRRGNVVPYLRNSDGHHPKSFARDDGGAEHNLPQVGNE